MSTFHNFDELTKAQLEQYKEAIPKAFPKVIIASQTSKKYWPRLENYFPQYQFYLIAGDGNLIGFMNTIPFYFGESLVDLPITGWDWMLEKGVQDFEEDIKPNYLGGLQVIVRKAYQGLGYSKEILNYAKELIEQSHLSKLLIPIRPTKKHEYPKMQMASYLHLRQDSEIYDPWIRTHVKGGADIIKVCENSMNIKGDLKFWSQILDRQLSKSGSYLAPGALSPIQIDVKKNTGEYREANVWIAYD